MNFGERLKALREETNPKPTQKELGDKLNLTQQKISYLENNTYEPTLQELHNICKYFNISADYLLGFKKPLPFPTR